MKYHANIKQTKLQILKCTVISTQLSYLHGYSWIYYMFAYFKDKNNTDWCWIIYLFNYINCCILYYIICYIIIILVFVS